MNILIVGTVPYNPKTTSRAFESYFHGMNKEELAQIFSNAKIPPKGHCGKLFQITDYRLLRRRFSKSEKTGKEFVYDELPDAWNDDSLEVGSGIAKLYRFGSKKNALVYLMRKLLWKKKYWCTPELNKWLDEFSPDCVFLSFSDDFFIPEIALYVAEKYNIPIISSIGDDYYFNYGFSFSPLYHLYKLAYRRLIRKVFSQPGSAIYIGNKIRDKYNEEFGLDGKTVYLTSDIERRKFYPIDRNNLKISYCGNIRLGRNDSIMDIGDALGRINPEYAVDVYSNENDRKFYQMLEKHSNIRFHGSVSYSEVKKIMSESDIVIVVEGFRKKDVDITKYSLSTKVADSLASGANVFTYGSLECGAVAYMAEIDCGAVCFSKAQLEKAIRKLIFDEEYQKKNYLKTKEIFFKNHRLESSIQIFRSVVKNVLEVKKC